MTDEHPPHNYEVYGGSCIIDETMRDYLDQYFWFLSGEYVVRLTMTGFVIPMAIQVLGHVEGMDADSCHFLNHPDAISFLMASEEGVTHVPGSTATEQVVHLSDLYEPVCDNPEHQRQGTPSGLNRAGRRAKRRTQ